VSELDAEFSRGLEARQALRRAVADADADIAAALRAGSIAEDRFIALVDRAEAFRVRLNVSRIGLLLRMNRLLSAAQRSKLRKLDVEGRAATPR